MEFTYRNPFGFDILPQLDIVFKRAANSKADPSKFRAGIMEGWKKLYRVWQESYRDYLADSEYFETESYLNESKQQYELYLLDENQFAIEYKIVVREVPYSRGGSIDKNRKECMVEVYSGIPAINAMGKYDLNKRILETRIHWEDIHG